MAVTNRQVLSIFFVVVVLLGMFFALGHREGPVRAAATGEIGDAIPAAETKPLVIDAVTSPEEQIATPPSEVDKIELKKIELKKIEVEKIAAPVVPVAKNQIPKTVVKVEAPPPDVSQPEQSAPPSSSTPLTGIFLQLEATTRMQAETMVAALHGNGFASLSTEIPERAGTYRVLVGPVHSGGLIKLRADLEAAGFPGKVGMIRLY